MVKAVHGWDFAVVSLLTETCASALCSCTCEHNATQLGGTATPLLPQLPDFTQSPGLTTYQMFRAHIKYS